MDKVSMSHLISFSICQTKCVIKFLDSYDIINFKIFPGSISKAMTDKEKKDRKTKIQKFKYLKNEKSFLI